ncbi:MAG TPA: FtsX-like permease family protein [Actinomycetota bacterium]|nr:FtsX-like permease family protein [Actinomycetota bacterium]
MLSVILTGLWARKRRLIGMLAAVVLGVGFLAGALALGDTLSANFNQLFTQASAGTDVVVRAPAAVGTGLDASRPLIPQSLVAAIAKVPGVADAQPSITGSGQIIGSDGNAVGGLGPPRTAGAWISDPALTPYRLVEGRAPAGANEVVINKGAALSGHLQLGQEITVETPAAIQVRIVGIVTFGDANGFGQATYVGFSLPGAQAYVTGRPGSVSSILVRAASGVTQPELAARIARVLPANVQALTGAVVTQQTIADLTGGFLSALRALLVIFAAIALLVATFSIVNTFSILMAQRSREQALLRSLGGTRRQLLLAVLAEALALGIAASGLGLACGLAIAGLLKGVFDSFGFALPAGGLVISPTTVIAALVVGIGVTVGAGLFPALRASRVPPLAALRGAAVEAPPSLRRRLILGAGAGVLGAILLAVGVTTAANGLRWVGLGSLLATVAVVVLGPVAARSVAGWIGTPFESLRGMPGALARENARRNPRRTAAAATALMVGVAVVSLFTVFARSISAAGTAGVSDAFKGDIAVVADGFGPGGVAPQLVGAIAALPGIGTVSGIGEGQALIGGRAEQVSVIDPATLPAVLDLAPAAGSLAKLQPDQLAVSQAEATKRGWHLGSTVTAVLPDGTRQALTVGALYGSRVLTGDYLLPQALWAPHALQSLDAEIYVTLPPGAPAGPQLAAVKKAAAPFGKPSVEDRATYLAQAGSAINVVLGIVYVLLALAIVIAVLGIANTLSLAVHERTREIGLLRAVGQTRRQLRTMIRLESVVISLFGAIGGVGLGLVLGLALAEAAGQSDGLTKLSVPVPQLVVILALGAVAGLLAAIRPARRAARMPLLGAITAE